MEGFLSLPPPLSIPEAERRQGIERAGSATDRRGPACFYANDGVAPRRRILPEGWVGYSATPTPGSQDGYGAGFFTNRGASDFGQRRVRGGMPADAAVNGPSR
jgi:hypothetical protein